MKFFKNSQSIGLVFLIVAVGQMQASLPGFNGPKYLEFNPDVKNAGMNPIMHFMTYGYKENRKIQIDDPARVSHIGNFSLADYLKKNPDLAPNLGVTNADVATQLGALFNHYQQYVYKENRNILTNATTKLTPDNEVLGLGYAICDPIKNGADCASGICLPDVIQPEPNCGIRKLAFVPTPLIGVDGKPVFDDKGKLQMTVFKDDCEPIYTGYCTCDNDSQCTSDRQCIIIPGRSVTFKGQEMKNCENTCLYAGEGSNKNFGCKCSSNGECGKGLICTAGQCDVAEPKTLLETLQFLKNVMREIKEGAQALSQAPQGQRIGKLIALQNMQGNNVGIPRLGGYLEDIAKAVPVQLQGLLTDASLRSGLVDLINNLVKALAPLSLKTNDIKVMQDNPKSPELGDVQKAITALAQYADQAEKMEKLFDAIIQKNAPKKSPMECLNLVM